MMKERSKLWYKHKVVIHDKFAWCNSLLQISQDSPRTLIHLCTHDTNVSMCMQICHASAREFAAARICVYERVIVCVCADVCACLCVSVCRCDRVSEWVCSQLPVHECISTSLRARVHENAWTNARARECILKCGCASVGAQQCIRESACTSECARACTSVRAQEQMCVCVCTRVAWTSVRARVVVNECTHTSRRSRVCVASVHA